MAHGIPARLTPQELRRFGLAVGAAFGVLALVFWWRGAAIAPWVAVVVSAPLVVLGIAAPATLAPVYRGWMQLARVLSRFTTPIVMGVLFYLLITPIGLVMRLAGHNPLVRPRGRDTFWIDRARGSRRSALDRPH